MSESPVVPGQILSGRFRVERVLGVGGMGVVVEATHLQLQQRIALKFLLPQLVVNEEAVQRFLREARAAATIRSEHVVRVSDVGTLDDGAPYMVMEYLEGIDLSQKLTAETKLDPVEATELIMQSLEAVAEAHAARIIHRDLKPANLFLAHRRDGSSVVKVLDFGISKALDQNALNLTQTSSVMGSPLYMSPEQLRSSRGVDQRSDIWSIGVILYELVSGDTPFIAESFGGLALAIGIEPHKPLIEVRPECPQALSDAVDKCLMKKASDRFQSVAELANALRSVTTSRGAMISVERIASTLGEAPPSSVRAPAPSNSGTTGPRPAQTGPQPAMLGHTNAGLSQTRGGIDVGRPGWLIGVSAVSALGAIAVGVAIFASTGGKDDAEAGAEGTPPAQVAAQPPAAPVPPPPKAEPVVAPVQAPPPVAEAPAETAKPAEPAAPEQPKPVTTKTTTHVASKPVVMAPRPTARPATTTTAKPASTAKSGYASGFTRQ